MNFVKLYIGDYLRDTGTLTLAQHGAYTLMLLEYYATEKPLPTGRDLHRLLRADSKSERDAIDFIAGKFWALGTEGLTNPRADKEIERALHQRAINQEVGKRGGRPKTTDSRTDSDTDSDTRTEPNRNPNQTPDTRLKENPPTPAKRGSAGVHDFPPGFEVFWVAYPRKIAKVKAAQAFARIKPDAELLARILAAVAVQSCGEQWTKDGGQFIPHPASWLNARRWEDEGVSIVRQDKFAGAM